MKVEDMQRLERTEYMMVRWKKMKTWEKGRKLDDDEINLYG